MQLLVNILTGGDSSRLNRTLVEDEQLALSVDGYVDESIDPGLVYFFLTLPPGADPDAVEQRLLEELGRVVGDGVTEAELQKARNQAEAAIWQQLATIRGKADAIGNYEVFHGDYEALFRIPARVAAVTVDDLQKAAADVFRVNNMTVGVLRAPAEPAE